MADIELIKGADNGNQPDTLRQMYPKVNRNFDKLNKEIADHKVSTSAHAAQDITYSGDAPGANAKDAIDNTYNRISEIVAQAGDDNTEIVDARDGFTTLGDRLNASDAQLAETVKKGDLIINAKDYGAVGDGVTDDSVAIEAAIQAAGIGGVVYLPKGRYYIETTLTISEPVKLMGIGKAQTWILSKAGISAIELTPGKDGYEITGITVNSEGTTRASGTIGISGIGTNLSPNGIGYTRITDVRVVGFEHGIHLEYNQLCHISKIHCEANAVGIYSKRCVNMQYEAVISQLNTSFGFYIDGDAGFISYSCGSLLQGCTLVNNGENGGSNFYIVYNEYFSIVNCMIDVPYPGSAENIKIAFCTRGNVIGNWIGASHGIGINVLASNELTFIGNEIAACAMMGIVLDSSGHNIIKGNSFTNNGDADVVLVGSSSRNLISSNMMMSTTSAYSIADSNHSIITDNFCRKSIIAHETSIKANNFENY